MISPISNISKLSWACKFGCICGMDCSHLITKFYPIGKLPVRLLTQFCTFWDLKLGWESWTESWCFTIMIALHLFHFSPSYLSSMVGVCEQVATLVYYAFTPTYIHLKKYEGGRATKWKLIMDSSTLLFTVNSWFITRMERGVKSYPLIEEVGRVEWKSGFWSDVREYTKLQNQNNFVL